MFSVVWCFFFVFFQLKLPALHAHCCSFKRNCLSSHTGLTPRFQQWLWLLHFQAKVAALAAALFKRPGTVLAVWFGSTHCGSWALAPCQAKQKLIPSAGKARPPLPNPVLSSLVVWNAHTAVPPCISPLGWKEMLLVGIEPPSSVHGTLLYTQGQCKERKIEWRDHKINHWQDSQLVCIYSQLMITEGYVTYSNVSRHHRAGLWILKQQISTSDHPHLCPIILK